MELVPHIRQLIAAHDYVVIPGFGGFVGKYASAHIHPGTHLFHPPNKSLAFNRNLTNDDGLLVHHLTHQMGLTSSEAQQEIKQFTAQLNQKLEQKEVVILDGIGRIFRDMEDRIRFKQDEESILLTASYGLPQFKADPILRKKLVDTGPAIKTEEDTEETTRRSIPTWMWAAASVVIVLAIIFGSYFAMPGLQQKTKSLMGWNGDSGMVASYSTVMTEASVGTIDWKLDNFARKAYPSVPMEILSPFLVSVNTNIPTGYFVVVGSFKNRNNARDLMNQMKQDDWNAFLFPTAENGFNRVGLFISKSNPLETNRILNEIRNSYREDAWVVRNKGK